METPNPPGTDGGPAAPPPEAPGAGCGAPAGDGPENGVVAIVGVRRRGQVRVTQFNAAGFDFEIGQRIVVEGDTGTEIGEVAQPTTRARRMCGIGCMKKALRVASDDDLKAFQQKAETEVTAGEFCREKIGTRELGMKLVRVEQTLETRKLTFYFTADGRVDFRELVRDIAQRFKCRVEMRQIGVRDEAGVRGGYGPCGRTLCCSTFLQAFAPISIKMAKEQKLSLNPSKLSGMCGRLKCCLRYEYFPAGGETALPPEDEPLPPSPNDGGAEAPRD
jgi:cell fate regulator YaaT (PSP1 superfamily)